MDTFPKSWSEARRIGSNKYYTGKPCPHGHDTYRYTNTKGCAGCAKEKSRTKKSINRVKAWYRSLSNRERMLLWAKYRHKKYSTRPFDLDESDFDWPTHCPALGIRLIYESGNRTIPNRATIDRLDPSLGYEKGNVAVISRKANLIKNNGTYSEIAAVANWLKNVKDL